MEVCDRNYVLNVIVEFFNIYISYDGFYFFDVLSFLDFFYLELLKGFYNFIVVW